MHAESVAEFAALSGFSPGTLAQTMAEYGDATGAGRDDLFGRAPATLMPLIAPLYAIQMHPGVATASGGPRRDALARVLRPGGEPIPGLFAGGAAGSIWGHVTEHGGRLTDGSSLAALPAQEPRGPHSAHDRRLHEPHRDRRPNRTRHDAGAFL